MKDLQFIGFYLAKSPYVWLYGHLPYRIEFDKDEPGHYMVRTEERIFYITKGRLKERFKKCPKKVIDERIAYLESKLQLYKKFYEQMS